MHTTQEQAVVASISVQIPDGEFVTRQLRTGETLAVGSDATAQLRLESPGVAGMHCILAVEQESVNLRDCYSATGTMVDGNSVREISLDYSCSIQVADNVIELQFKNSKPRPSVPPIVAPAVKQILEELKKDEVPVEDASSIFSDEEEFSTEALDSPSSRITNLLLELEEARTEITVLQERLQTTSSLSTKIESDPFQQEMIDLLREEVLALQSELAKHHQEGTPSRPQTDFTPMEDLPSRDEVEKLVSRLETLLTELTTKDEHLQLLQDLLLASDNANQAEQEEREQLSKWLGEFEQRFEVVSQEWELEKEQLHQKLTALQSERDEAQVALSADTSTARSEALQRLSETLRQQILQQQAEIEKLQDQNAQLEERVKDAEGSTSREEEIRLSRERAEIARMRHDLEKRMQQAFQMVKQTQRKQQTDSETEQKVREYREQLRETESQPKSTPTLSSRIGDLWGRLNS